jgi:two-component system NtrC family sensor kinase
MLLLKETYLYMIPPLMGFLVFTVLSLISLLRGRKSHTNRLFAAICFFGALINIDVALVSCLSDKALALKIDRLIYIFFVFSIPVYIRFIHEFLEISKRRFLEITAYLFSLIMLVFTQTDYFIMGLADYPFGTIARGGPAFHIFSLAGGFTALYCLAALFVEMQKTGDGHRKKRIRYVLTGLGFGALLILLNSLPVLGFHIYPLGNFSFAPAIILAVGVLKYDLLDIGSVIRKGTVYFLLTGIVTIMYVLIIYVFNIFFMGYGDSGSVLLPLLLSLLIVLLFNPIRTKVQGLVDNLFFRGRYDYHKTLMDMSNFMTSLLRLDEIVTYLLDSISSTLKVRSVSLLISGKEKGNPKSYSKGIALPEEITEDMRRDYEEGSRFFTERREALHKSVAERVLKPDETKRRVLNLFEKLGATLVIPLVVREELTGIIALGEKKSGELFVQEDVELLITLANQSAIAIENARIYGEIEELNTELEKKVEKRTADLVRTLEEKERAQQELVRSESLAAIGQLVAGTAHELNNPLASASSLVQTAIEEIESWDTDGESKDDLLDDLRFSLKEMKRAGNIVKSLLGLSRQTQTYVEPVNIGVVIDDALRVLYNQYKNLKVNIEKDYDEGLPEIEGNFANLGQVFINIIKNAVQALPDGEGTITLLTRYREDTDSVYIECRDTGVGIAPGEIENVFKPFFTMKKPGEGTGLGLYVSHEIIKRHDGNISVKSEKGRGTVFAIELPCKRRE